MRRSNVAVWGWLLVVVAVVAVVRTAGGEEALEAPQVGEGQSRAALPLAPPEPAPVVVVSVRGVPFVWPALDSAAYADEEAAAARRLVARWRDGTAPAGMDGGSAGRSPAGLYLAADLAFLRATAGDLDYWTPIGAYELALRGAPDFADAPRALFVLGQLQLSLGLGPEAGASFVQLERGFPGSGYLLDARLGQAAALRLRRRPAEARRMLDEVLTRATGEVRCRAYLEEVAQARTAGVPAAVEGALARVVERCPQTLGVPGVLHDYAEMLAGGGNRARARALLGAPRATLPADEEARLALLAGSLAEDPAEARAAWQRVHELEASAALALEADMRIALLDARSDPQQTARTLAALAERPGPVALRAAIIGKAAEVSAEAGRFGSALSLLDRAARLDPDGTAQADGRRRDILARWLAALQSQDDLAGIAIVYAAHATDIDALAGPEGRLVVAHALRTFGLDAMAASALAASGAAGEAPEVMVARAETALAAGDSEGARAALAAIASTPLPDGLGRRARAAATRLALVGGDLERAAAEAGESDDVALRTEVALAALVRPGGAAEASALLQPLVARTPDVPVRALLVAATAAAGEAAWDVAARIYERALERAAAGSERLEAGAGLARAARARGDAVAAAAALAQVAGEDDLARRAAALASHAAQVARAR